MFAALRHSARFARVLWVLKRYGAWFAVRRLGPMPVPVRALLALAALPAPGKAQQASEGKRLAEALTHLGPAYIKLGQTLATRPDIVGPTIAADLGALQDKLPPFSDQAARQAIEASLGKPIDALFSEFQPTPVAAASIAQVHKAETAEGGKVAVKVVRPGIDAKFGRDLMLLPGRPNGPNGSAPRPGGCVPATLWRRCVSACCASWTCGWRRRRRRSCARRCWASPIIACPKSTGTAPRAG